MTYYPRTMPYEHQTRAQDMARDRPFFAFFMEMGTGKTKVEIDEIADHFERGVIDCALILAPKGVYMNWVSREIPTHMPERVIESASIVEWRSGGGSKSHQETLIRLLKPSPGRLRVLVMNTEALSTQGRATTMASRFVQSGRCIVVVDESTGIKNHSASRTKMVVALGRMATMRRILTGSPGNSPLDLYSQFDFLEPGSLGSRSFYAFRARYAVMREMQTAGRKFQVVVAYRGVEDLADRVGRHSFRVTKEQCLDLPPKIYMRRDVAMTDEQARLYSEMRDFAIMQLSETETVTASAVITQRMRLQQLLCGHLRTDDGGVRSIPTNRVGELIDAVSEIDGGVIIWTRWRPDIPLIVGSLEHEYGEGCCAQYHGGNVDTREAESQDFIDGRRRFLVSTQQSGGRGNTWLRGTTVIYYSNHDSWELRAQSEDRSHRSGQTSHVTYIDLVTPGTVDEKILRNLRENRSMAATITRDQLTEWL